jgi:hypothetical protein
MSEYISLEIDLEILDMLIEDAAAGTEYWTVLNNGVYNPSNANGFDFPTTQLRQVSSTLKASGSKPLVLRCRNFLTRFTS